MTIINACMDVPLCVYVHMCGGVMTECHVYFIFALKLLGVEENMWERTFLCGGDWGHRVLVSLEKQIPLLGSSLLNKRI